MSKILTFREVQELFPHQGGDYEDKRKDAVQRKDLNVYLAYTWLRLQKHTKKTVRHIIKSTFEAWTGCYLSYDDIKDACSLIPSIILNKKEHYIHVNVSRKVVFPSYGFIDKEALGLLAIRTEPRTYRAGDIPEPEYRAYYGEVPEPEYIGQTGDGIRFLSYPNSIEKKVYKSLSDVVEEEFKSLGYKYCSKRYHFIPV